MTKHTDKQLLLKGLKYLAFTLPLLVASPYLLTLAFMNKGHYFFYIAFPLGLLAGAGAIYMGFKGINTILKSIF